MKLELLLQVIVPLTFLAIWALTSLLNRDAQPLPPRPGTRPPGTGPGTSPGMARSGYVPPSRPEPTRSGPPGRPSTSPGLDRSSAGRWSTTTATGRPSPSFRGGDEGIVILDDERRGTSGQSSAARPTRGLGPAARKTAARVRSAIAAPVQPPERPRTLAGLTAEPLGPRRGRPLEMIPLSAPMTPISATPLTVDSSSPDGAARVVSPVEPPTLTADELAAMLASPKRLREVALLGELLQPPVSLRAPRRSP